MLATITQGVNVNLFKDDLMRNDTLTCQVLNRDCKLELIIQDEVENSPRDLEEPGFHIEVYRRNTIDDWKNDCYLIKIYFARYRLEQITRPTDDDEETCFISRAKYDRHGIKYYK